MKGNLEFTDLWSREMTQGLRAHPALEEGPNSFPSTHIRCSQLPVTLVPGDPTPSSGLHGSCCTYVHKLECRHTLTHFFLKKYNLLTHLCLFSETRKSKTCK